MGIMAGIKLVTVLVLAVVGGAHGARQLRSQQMRDRDQRSLVNTFPFNSNDEEHHHAHHQDHAEVSQSLDSRAARQGAEGESVSFADVAAAGPGPDGKKCIDKVEMVEETEYDDVVQCDHSYDKRCHTTYTTNYESQQEEDCEENFRKTCFIAYEQIAFNETVQICRTEYESECWTKQEVHDVEDDVVECRTEVEEKC